MNSNINKRYGKPIIIACGILFIFLLWWIIALAINSDLFPSPRQAFITLATLLGNVTVWTAIGGTLLRLLISFAISFIAGLILGIIAGRFKSFYTFLNPLIIVLRTIPTAAIIYALIVLTKPAFAVQIVVFLMMFPIMYEATVSGVRQINEGILEATKLECRILSSKSLTNVIIPAAWPSILLGIIQALGLGMKGSIMAEVLCGSDTIPGIGRIIYHGYIEYKMDIVFAMTIIAVILIALLDILLKLTKKKITTLK